MKTIYYVIQETNGLKDVRAYEIKNGKMNLLCELGLVKSDNTENNLIVELETKNLIQSKPNLIEL